MNKLLLAASAGLAAIAAGAPAASAQIYGGVGYTAFQVDQPGGDDAFVGSALARAGYKFNPFLGVEGEIAVGLVDGEVDISPGVTADVGVDNEYGVFGTAWLPIPFLPEPFLRAGYANMTIESDVPGGDFDGGGLAYGGGLQFSFLIAKLRAEYTRYEIDDDSLDSFGLSALLQF
jgi:outer membrane immunogenic protein